MKNISPVIFIFLSAIILLHYNCFSPNIEEGLFDTYVMTPVGPKGLYKLQNTKGKFSTRISKASDSEIKIESLSPEGIVQSTQTIILDEKGNLRTLTSRNEFGEIGEISVYQKESKNAFLVESKYQGKNTKLPCRYERHIFENGFLTRVEGLDENKQPCNDEEGVAIRKYEVYKNGLNKSWATFDAQGEPVNSKTIKCHKYTTKRNEQGKIVEGAYWDLRGNPATKNGVHKTVYEYNQNGIQTAVSYFAIDGEKTEDENGVHKVSAEIVGGRSVKDTRFNKNGDIAKTNALSDGAAIVKNEFDGKGNLTKMAYFDENENPINSNYDYHYFQNKYNSEGQLVAESYFNKSDNPILDRFGVHQYYYTNDQFGNVIEMAYFDKENRPAMDQNNRVYMIKYKYDELGRQVSISYWKNSKNKMTRWDGYHEAKFIYDQNGFIVEVLYSDENGNLKVSSSGGSREKREYLASGQISKVAYFDGKMPVLVKQATINNYHAINYEYVGSKTIKILYCGTGGDPINAVIDGTPASIVEFIYKSDELIEQRFYKAGESVPTKFRDCLKVECVGTGGRSSLKYH